MTEFLAVAGGGLAVLNLFPSTARWWQTPIAVLMLCAAVVAVDVR